MIHEHTREGETVPVFLISSRECWLPGNYATAEAARYAFQFSNAELVRLEAKVCWVTTGEGRAITLDDLRAARKARV